MRLAHPDWLAHRLTVTGPDLDAFRRTTQGPGTIPWFHDLDAMAEDWFHLLMARPTLPTSLTAQGARILARQLRDAVGESHERAQAHRAHPPTPFDLHAITPIPAHLLRRGPDDPASLDWLWRNWGTTWPLRRVQSLPTPDGLCLAFWSADWTPWPAIATLRARFPTLEITVAPGYAHPTDR